MGKKSKQQQLGKPQQNKPKHKINKPELIPQTKGPIGKKGKSPMPQLGGVNLFNIIPENDNFAALGPEESDEEVEYH